MFYAKFAEDNKSIEMRLDPPPAGEEDAFVVVQDDSLYGKRLVKLKTKVREFTEKEYAEEQQAADKSYKKIVIDNMVRYKLNATQHLALPDYFEALSDSDKEKIKNYRDSLREVKNQPGYPEEVIFPDELNI